VDFLLVLVDFFR